MTLLETTKCIVMTERDGEISWLGVCASLPEAQAAMEEWLQADERDEEDSAFILPCIGFGRAMKEG